MESTPRAAGRNLGIDAGRLVAVACVIAVHIDPRHTVRNEWALLAWEVLCRWAVPYFFIAAGYFALRSTASFRHAIVYVWQRIVPLIVVWNFIYFILRQPPKGGEAWRVLLTGASSAPHLWFFPSLAICMLLLAASRKVATPAGVLIGALVLYAAGLAYGSYSPLFIDAGVRKIWNVRNGPFFGFAFVSAGYFLRTKGAPSLTAGLLMFASGAALQAIEMYALYRFYGIGFDRHDFMFGTLLMGTGAFVAFLHLDQTAFARWAAKLGTASLGVYAVHLLFLRPLQSMIMPNRANLLQAALLLVVTLMLSLGTALIVRQVPSLRRYVT